MAKIFKNGQKMNTLKKWLYLAMILAVLYYIFIVNMWLTLAIIASSYVGLKLYKWYALKKLNRLSGSKVLFRQSALGHFIALAAKVAKADGRVSELEAQLISMMFDDISNIFIEKERTRAILKEIFNEEKEKMHDTKEVAASLNQLLGRSLLKRKQFIGFLIQLAFVDNGLSTEEDQVLREIVTALNLSINDYELILRNFENVAQNKQEGMGLKEACDLLGVKESDDMGHIKKTYRKLVHAYHPDIMISQNKDEAYIEEATAKMQKINQAYKIIKEAKA